MLKTSLLSVDNLQHLIIKVWEIIYLAKDMFYMLIASHKIQIHTQGANIFPSGGLS